MKSCYRIFRIALLSFIGFAAGPLALSGCNTTAGIGQDLEAAGDAIEGEARENQEY